MELKSYFRQDIIFSKEDLIKLDYYCNFRNGSLLYCPDTNSNYPPLAPLRAPSTFFICLTQCIVSLVIGIIIIIGFNSVKVLGRKSYTSSTSGLLWILYYFSRGIFYLTIVLFLPKYSNSYHEQNTIDTIGFYVLRFFHVIALFFICCALDHEWRFRTTATATLTVHPYSVLSKLRNTLKYFINWSRLLFLIQAAVLILIAIILGTTAKSSREMCTGVLAIIYIAALVLLLCTIWAIGLAVILKTNKAGRPNGWAKLCLFIALVLQITEILPIFVVNSFIFNQDQICFLRIISPYDAVILLSFIPSILYLIFIGLEYKRVEPINKYAIVADLQALLQFQKN